MLKKYQPSYRELLKLAGPLVLTQAGQMTVQLTDTAMVGRVGSPELAAASFANSIYIVIMIFGIGIFIGITPLLSQARGAGDDNRSAAVMKNGLILSAALIPFMAVITWGVSWIMPHMGQSEEVVRLAIPYYHMIAIAMIPFLLFVLLKQIGEGLGNTSAAMVATITANVINIGLCYILIYGKLGFPKFGLMGAGYATLIARTIMPLFLYVKFISIGSTKKYFALIASAKSSLNGILKIFNIGLPIAAQLVLEISAFSFSAIMMGWLGVVPLAAHQVALGLASFTFMIANSMANAATMRVSFYAGARNFESMERIAYSAIHLALTFMGICGIAFLLFRRQLAFLFTNDAGVIEQTAILLMVAALFQLFDGLQICCLGILRGFSDVKAPMFISAFSYIAIGLSVSYGCAFTLKLGPVGIWYGFLAGIIVAGSLLFSRIKIKIRQIEAAR